MSIESRVYTTKRQGIVHAITNLLKKINGTGEFVSDLEEKVYPKLVFFDEIAEFPSVYVTAGSERRVYQGGGYKDRYLSIVIRVYVQEEDAQKALDEVLEDIEFLLEDSSRLLYYDKNGTTQHTHQITIISIDTDEGVLDPIGVGTILIEVHY